MLTWHRFLFNLSLLYNVVLVIEYTSLSTDFKLNTSLEYFTTITSFDLFNIFGKYKKYSLGSTRGQQALTVTRVP